MNTWTLLAIIIILALLQCGFNALVWMIINSIWREITEIHEERMKGVK